MVIGHTRVAGRRAENARRTSGKLFRRLKVVIMCSSARPVPHAGCFFKSATKLSFYNMQRHPHVVSRLPKWRRTTAGLLAIGAPLAPHAQRALALCIHSAPARVLGLLRSHGAPHWQPQCLPRLPSRCSPRCPPRVRPTTTCALALRSCAAPGRSSTTPTDGGCAALLALLPLHCGCFAATPPARTRPLHRRSRQVLLVSPIGAGLYPLKEAPMATTHTHPSCQREAAHQHPLPSPHPHPNPWPPARHYHRFVYDKVPSGIPPCSVCGWGAGASCN